MSTVVDDRLVGSQIPRLGTVAVGDTTRGDAAVEFCRWAGMTLFPWQENLLRDMCRTDQDGLWRYRETVAVVPRQNGKGEVLIARELAGIYLFGEKEILHTAHFLDTSIEARDRLWEVIESNDDLMEWWVGEHDGRPWLVKTNGKEGIEFPNGAKIRFRTRTEKTGRGLSIELLVFDECFNLPNQIYSAISKTTRAREHSHTIFISSPVDRTQHMHGAVFSAKRWAGIDNVGGVLFREWSADVESVDIFSEKAWKQSNPSLVLRGVGAQLADIRSDSDAARSSEVLKAAYLVESLGVGNWVPRDNAEDEKSYIVVPEEWSRLQGVPHGALGDSVLALDATPDGEKIAMAAAVAFGDGRAFLTLGNQESFDSDAVVASVAGTVEENDPLAILMDKSGPVGTLISPLESHGIEPEQLSGGKISAAYELLLSMIREGKIIHDGNPRWLECWEVAEERRNATYRSLNRFVGNVAPLVAASLALWGLREFSIPDSVDVKSKKRFVGSADVVSAAGTGIRASEIEF
ncbi:terminase large subunit domain-containing protein [Corynebacterium ulcerans]|uniref:terminase large subunit domain-containing protein n=1 Tax=Corynebacterium ulcerans TaxID=65058 RepID=UPI0002141C1C|nr:terminase family protein [Corynebacterium ulcerans]AEG83889.1 hypothetical protein CULC22_01179 [Corynebacterium ulcerans BR-AD22]